MEPFFYGRVNVAASIRRAADSRRKERISSIVGAGGVQPVAGANKGTILGKRRNTVSKADATAQITAAEGFKPGQSVGQSFQALAKSTDQIRRKDAALEKRKRKSRGVSTILTRGRDKDKTGPSGITQKLLGGASGTLG